MQVLLDSSTPGFNLILVLAQDLLFQSLLKLTILEKILEDIMANVLTLKKKRLNSFYAIYICEILVTI